ncbi:MAG: hypothetical protein JO340_03835 [Acidobacteriaceae bacterium]|nr:hypothetical protein [Acidobacteriaceae bacterium]
MEPSAEQQPGEALETSGPGDSAIYFSEDWAHYAAGRSGAVWLIGDRVVRFTREESFVLLCCKRPNSHAGHLRAIRAHLPHLSEEASTAILRKLIDTQALVQFTIQRAAGLAPESDSALTTFCVVTANRPDYLKRCLTSFLVHALRYRTPLTDVIVCDASSPELIGQTSEVCAGIEKAHDIRISHFSSVVKRNLHAVLSRRGIPPSVLRFGLPAETVDNTPGANRNWSLILTAGRQFLSADDDTVATPWQPSESGEDLRLAGHADPFDYAFYDTRAEAIRDLPLSDDSVFRVHGRFLHRRVTEVLSSNARLSIERACSHLLNARGARGRIVLSYSGIAGDSGMPAGVRFLLSTGTTREQLAVDPNSYRRALHSREMRRIAPALTVNHDQICMLTVAGIDNDSFLPPFPPAGRNEDGAFGTLLKLLLPESAFANPPVGLLHDSSRISAYSHTAAHAASRPRVSDLLIRMMLHCPLSGDLRAEARLKAVAAYLKEISGCSAKAFGDIIDRLSRRHCASMIAQVDELMSAFAYPSVWIEDLLAYRSALQDSVADGSCAAASDLPPSQSLQELQGIAAGFGELLMWWPSLREAGKDLKAA